MPVNARAGDRSEPRTSGVLGAAVGAALLYSTVYFASTTSNPLLLLIAAVSPLPLMLLRLRGGLGPALLATLMAASMLGWVFGPRQALLFVLALAVPGLLIGHSLGRGRGLVRGCGWAFAWLASGISIVLLIEGPQIASAVLAVTEQKLHSPQALEEMRASGLPPEQAEEWAERFRTWNKGFAVVYPAAFIIMGAGIVLVNAALLRAYLARRDPGWLEGGEFETIRWPFAFSVFFVLAGLSVVTPLRAIGYNILLLLAFFYGLQGLAVVAYYTHRLAAPPLLRAGLLFLVLVNPWAPQMLALLGLFDTWFDFRKWADPPQREQGK
jgi:uncharacterized protein YybS (DUF2232 family)